MDIFVSLFFPSFFSWPEVYNFLYEFGCAHTSEWYAINNNIYTITQWLYILVRIFSYAHTAKVYTIYIIQTVYNVGNLYSTTRDTTGRPVRMIGGKTVYYRRVLIVI